MGCGQKDTIRADETIEAGVKTWKLLAGSRGGAIPLTF